jgi:hypothetical protein
LKQSRDEERVWLETVVLIEAAVAFWLSALNALLLGRTASQSRGRARRAAAVVLACVCGGQALEALLFLWLGETSGTGGWPQAALLLVRTALLVSTGLISLLLVRGLSMHR